MSSEQNYLNASAIIIGGFSQGCMISLQTGLKRKDQIHQHVQFF